MNSLSGYIATLGGVAVFCASALLGLVRSCPPLEVLKKALICAAAFACVAWAAAWLAGSVARDAANRQETDNSS